MFPKNIYVYLCLQKKRISKAINLQIIITVQAQSEEDKKRQQTPVEPINIDNLRFNGPFENNNTSVLFFLKTCQVEHCLSL